MYFKESFTPLICRSADLLETSSIDNSRGKKRGQFNTINHGNIFIVENTFLVYFIYKILCNIYDINIVVYIIHTMYILYEYKLIYMETFVQVYIYIYLCM